MNGETRRIRRKAAQRRAQRLGLNRGQARALAFRAMTPAGQDAARLVIAITAARKTEEATA